MPDPKPYFPIPQFAARALALAGLALLSAACGSPDERAARYVSAARQAYEAGELVDATLDVRNALQLSPRHADARYLKALLEERAGNFSAVPGQLAMAVAADPGHLEARLKLGNYHVRAGQTRDARAQADAALALAPGSAAAHLLDARTRYLEGRKDDAALAVGRALGIDPARQDAVTLKVTLLAEQGRYAEAGRDLDAAITRAGTAGTEGLRRVRVALFLTAGDEQAAEQTLLSLAADFPDNPSYDLALARLYARQGRGPAAEDRLRALIARDPDNSGWRVQLASLLAGQGQPDAAAANLADAVAANPHSTTLRLSLGGFYEAVGRLAEARATYQEIADAEPRTADGLAARNRLVALALGQDAKAARALVEGILADAPGNVDALLYRAAFQAADGALAGARADLTSALARQPDSPRALLMLARVQVLDDQTALAEGTYRRLLQIDSAHQAARQELATLLGNRGDAPAAAALLRDALRLDPGDRAASANLVRALLLERDFAAAEREARRLLELGEDSGLADYQLGLAIEARGDDQGALAAFRRALARSPLADPPLEALVALEVRTGGAAAAEAELASHLESHPGHGAGYLLLAGLQHSSGRTAAARTTLETLLGLQPEHVAAHLGLAGLEPAGSDARLARLRTAHERIPGSPAIGLALGAALEKRSAFEPAIVVYEAVLAAGGDSEFLVDNLAVLLLDHRGDPRSRVRALELLQPYATGRTASPVTLGILGWARPAAGRPPVPGKGRGRRR